MKALPVYWAGQIQFFVLVEGGYGYRTLERMRIIEREVAAKDEEYGAEELREAFQAAGMAIVGESTCVYEMLA